MAGVDEGQHESGTEWSGLLPELLAHTFKYLTVQERGRAARVCVSWRDASYQKSVWKNDVILWTSKINVTVNSTLVPSLIARGIEHVCVHDYATLTNLVRDFPHFRCLKSECYSKIGGPSQAAAILSSLPNFTELVFEQYPCMTDSDVEIIIGHLGNLELLTINQCLELTDTSLLAISRGLKKLKCLQLGSLTNATDKGIAYLTGCSDVMTSPPPKLNHLHLSYCPFVTDTAMLHLSIGQPDLKYLGVSYFKITGDGVKHLTKMKQLVDLDISFCENIDTAGIKHLASMPQLRTLDLACSSIDDAGLAVLATGSGVSGLTELCLRKCTGISDDGLESLAKMVNLRQLDLSCNNITDDGLANLERGNSNITSLFVIYCQNLTDECLPHLSKMTCLTTLNACWCNNVSAKGLEELGKDCALFTKSVERYFCNLSRPVQRKTRWPLPGTGN